MESIVVPASMERLQQVLAQIGLFLEREGCPENERRLMEISAEELFTNIASYAYGDKEGQVWVEYGTDNLEDGAKKAIICFKDQGSPFNPFARDDPDLTLPIEERPIGGLGIYMVKEFMDNVDYQCAGGFNITVVEKKFIVGGEQKE